MAGLAGRIKYLYEEENLTFSELKHILELISNNSIPLYEKVDGFNCFFSVRNNTPVMARNMTDINNGGLSIVELASRKFQGGSSVKKVFIEALKNFAKDLGPIDRTARRNIFESAGKQVFYNFEIVDKNTKRLFEYDSSGLILHDTGHFVVSEGKRIPFTNNLGNFKASLKESKFIKTNLKTSLTEHANSSIHSVIKKIDEIMEQNSFTGFNRIGDLKESNVIKSVLNEFSCSFINSLQSNLIENEVEKVKTFKGKLKEAVSSLMNFEGKDRATIIEKTMSYLKQIPDVDLVESCIEGVIFEHNNNLYKLTGYYGPINQLYSLYQNKVLNEFNTGHHFPLDNAMYAVDRVMTSPEKKTVAVFPGSFKPPHAGHYRVVEELLNRKNPEGFHVINQVVILISNKARMAQSAEASVYITAEISEELWKLYTEGDQSDGRVDVRIADHDTPIKCIFDLMLEEMAPKENMLLIKSSKDKDSDRFNIFDKFSRENELGINVEIEEMNVYSAGVSASNMRNWIADNDEAKFKGFLPDHLSADEQEEAWKIVQNSQDISLNENNSFFLNLDEGNVIKPDEIPSEELVMQAVKWEYQRGRSNDVEGLYNVVLANLESNPAYYSFLKKKDLDNLSENQGWTAIDIVDAISADFGFTDASDAPPWLIYCAEMIATGQSQYVMFEVVIDENDKRYEHMFKSRGTPPFQEQLVQDFQEAVSFTYAKEKFLEETIGHICNELDIEYPYHSLPSIPCTVKFSREFVNSNAHHHKYDSILFAHPRRATEFYTELVEFLKTNKWEFASQHIQWWNSERLIRKLGYNQVEDSVYELGYSFQWLYTQILEKIKGDPSSLKEVQHYQSLLTENRVEFIKDTYPDKLTNAVLSRWDYDLGDFNGDYGYISNEELALIGWPTKLLNAFREFLLSPENKWINQFPMPEEYKESLVNFFLDTDPTENKQYAQWLIIRFIKDKERIEDIHTMHPVLVDFHEMVERDIITGVDINKLSIRDLQNLVREKADDLRAKRVKSGDEEAVQDVIDAEVEILYKEGDSMMAIPTTMRAACVLGKDTNWCTAVDDEKYNMYGNYTQDGPLITFFAGDRKWQLHFESNQFMNEEDRPVDFEKWLTEYNQFKEPILDYYATKVEEYAHKQSIVGGFGTITYFVDQLYFEERILNDEIVEREVQKWLEVGPTYFTHDGGPPFLIGRSSDKKKKIAATFQYALKHNIFDKEILEILGENRPALNKGQEYAVVPPPIKPENMEIVINAADDSQFQYFLEVSNPQSMASWLSKFLVAHYHQRTSSGSFYDGTDSKKLPKVARQVQQRISDIFKHILTKGSSEKEIETIFSLLKTLLSRWTMMRTNTAEKDENINPLVDNEENTKLAIQFLEQNIPPEQIVQTLVDPMAGMDVRGLWRTNWGNREKPRQLIDYLYKDFLPLLKEKLYEISRDKNLISEFFTFYDREKHDQFKDYYFSSRSLGMISIYDPEIAEIVLKMFKDFIDEWWHKEHSYKEHLKMFNKLVDVPENLITPLSIINSNILGHFNNGEFEKVKQLHDQIMEHFDTFKMPPQIEEGSLSELYEGEKHPSLIEKILTRNERPIIIWMSKNHKDETDDIFLKTKLRAHELGIDPTEIYYAPFDEYVLEKHDLIEDRINGDNSYEFAIIPRMNARMHWYLKNLETDNHLSQKTITSYSWNSLNEVSEKPAQIAHNFMRQVEARPHMAELPFESIFGDKKTRIVLEMPKEYTGEMKDLMNFISKAGWDLNPKTGNVSREYKYKIPKGPKKGEEIDKKEEISLGKLLEKALSMFKALHKSCDALRKKIDDNIDEIERVIEKAYNGNLPASISRRTEFVQSLFSDDITGKAGTVGIINGYGYFPFFKDFLKEKQDILDKHNQLVKTFGKSVPMLVRVLDYLQDRRPHLTFISTAYFREDGNKIIDFINFWNSNSEKFLTNPTSMMDGNKIIVSRHPIDVLRMSDFSNIHSCHSENYSNDNYFYCAVYESQGLGAISYIISSKDYNRFLEENNIENPEDENSEFQAMEIFKDPDRNIDGMRPLARRRIKRYITPEGMDEFEIAIPSIRNYGNNLPYFYETLRDFLYSNQLDDIMNKFGFKSEDQLLSQGIPVEYVHPTGGTYRDNTDSDLFNNFFDGSFKYDDHDFGQHVGGEEEKDFNTDAQADAAFERLEEIVNEFDHLDVIPDPYDEGNLQNHVWLNVSFELDLENVIFDLELDTGAEDLDLSDREYRKKFEQIIRDVVSDFYIHIEPNGQYNLDWSVRLELEQSVWPLLGNDGALNLVQHYLADFDDNFEKDVIKPIIERAIEQGLLVKAEEEE